MEGIQMSVSPIRSQKEQAKTIKEVSNVFINAF